MALVTEGLGLICQLSWDVRFERVKLFQQESSSLLYLTFGYWFPRATALKNLRFLSLCGNNLTHLPRTLGRLNPNCDVHLQRNPNLVYPPAPHSGSVKSMRQYFHQERMALLRGMVLLVPHVKRSKFRANERLYRPGGSGYYVCRNRFEEAARKKSILM